MKKLLFAAAIVAACITGAHADQWKSVLASTTGVPQPGMSGYAEHLSSGTILDFRCTTCTVTGNLTVNGNITHNSSMTVTGPLTVLGAISAGTTITGGTFTARRYTENGSDSSANQILYNNGGNFAGDDDALFDGNTATFTRVNTPTLVIAGSTYNVTNPAIRSQTTLQSGATVYVSSMSVAGPVDASSATFFGQLTGKGTPTNDSAAAGFIGQYVSSAVTTQLNFPATNTYGDGVSMQLTPGDWDVTAQLDGDSNGATWSVMAVGISTNTGNNSTDMDTGDNRAVLNWANSATTPLEQSLCISAYRVSLAITKTYYLKIFVTFSANGPPKYRCRLSARRVR